MNSWHDPHLQSQVNLLTSFLARQDDGALSPGSKDIIVILGSGVLACVEVGAKAFHAGVAPLILTSGGIGHSTNFLWEACGIEDMSEADIFADLLTERHAVPSHLIVRETNSTNCAENAEATKVSLTQTGIYRPGEGLRLLLIQDPILQRRSHSSFERVFQDDPSVTLSSYAPFVPVLDSNGLRPKAWGWDRFVSLLLGEVPRFESYGPLGKGSISWVIVPEEVRQAHEALVEQLSVLNTRSA
ncbi:MAG: YdcF family protein [Fimbriimonadaceae bacterium]|jgi:uncharacterized SAM-binding protein YcdF (DUF218 family)|nr:YdcF family protein [Fimbriimonadaceae bacterium]